MSLVDHYSTIGSKTELALFSVPPTQVEVERGFNDEIQLANSCNSEGPWEFRIPPDINYIDARHNYIVVTLKIVKGDGGSIAPAVPVSHHTLSHHRLSGGIFYDITVYPPRIIYDITEYPSG